MEWASSFNPSTLQSEDDVETKFVLPLFKLLGYPEAYRRGKYPMDDYQSRKAGRKPEADQVYFSTEEQDKQNADTALLLIEAKKREIYDLSGAIVQAKYYGNLLKPPFLVITNGQQMIVLKRHQHHDEEIIADITIEQLSDQATASTLYDQLQFETVKKLKEQLLDPLRHIQYVELMRTLERYPDIQEQLAKGDFEPSIVRDERLLSVVKSKVAITCELPIVFAEGSCQIEFSNILLRGLTCHLSHEEILTKFLIGLETPPDWEARPFLQRTKQNTFEAQLGKTTVILSKREADELCNAVDEVCKQYKAIMLKATNILETWDFRPEKIEHEKGFELLSVETWLWEKMQQFAYEFDYDKGDSEWHIFDRRNLSIRVCPKGGSDHVIIWPKFGNGLFPNGMVDLLYIDSITYLYLYKEPDVTYDSIFQNVGPHGVWTASYTKKWLEQHFIPKVLSYFRINYLSPKGMRKNLIEWILLKLFPFSKSSQKRRDAVIQASTLDYSSEDEIPWAEICKLEQFAPYMHKIQSWFHHYRSYGASNMAASLLRPYYAAFTGLARCVDPTTVNVEYILGNLGAVGLRTKDDEDTDSQSHFSTYDDALTFLAKQVVRIQEANYENHYVADLLSRAFITIVEEGTFHLQQNQINAAKLALFPLWEQCRFADHFIDPILFP
ncbi:hypothetical protein KSF_063540 [Reticulibacter mediterranei]|uniref:Type I restriction enzyme R protein N-terminal domain-containing protein n=2 Tax=Reticulibacter mediterranei TaxID=2778369 RepID=A0A8J3IVZ9_9CHLR|nr:hypothetical protein KSF_063540 [Reticulibacter mediterranei]